MSEPSTILELQENAGVLKFVSIIIHYVICICAKLHRQCTLQVFASGITLLNAVSAGTCFGYQTTAAVTYPVPNATTLVEPMNESQLSWFSECILSLDVTYSSHQNWMISRFMNQHKF